MTEYVHEPPSQARSLAYHEHPPTSLERARARAVLCRQLDHTQPTKLVNIHHLLSQSPVLRSDICRLMRYIAFFDAVMQLGAMIALLRTSAPNCSN